MTLAKHLYVCLVLIVALAALGSTRAAGQRPGDTAALLPLDSLLGIQVSVASKYAQYMRDAPASVVVIGARLSRRDCSVELSCH